MNNVNLQICRVCLKNIGSFSIFSEHNRISIADMILSFADVKKIFPGDGKPILICFHCLRNVTKTYELSEQCKISSQRIENLFEVSMASSIIKSEYDFNSGNQYIHDNKYQGYVKETLNISEDFKTEIIMETVDLKFFNDKIVDTSKALKVKNKHKTKKTFKTKIKFDTKYSKNKSVNKPFKCDQCKKSFNTKGILKTHYVITHSDQKPFKCDLCGKCFKTKGLCSTHYKTTHSDERPFKCNLCGKSFKMKGLCETHYRTTHSDERPFKCKRCDKTFKTKGLCGTHYKTTHFDIRPFKCDYCGKCFKTKGVCITHYKLH